MVTWKVTSEESVAVAQEGKAGAAIEAIEIGKERIWVLADSGATKSLVSERLAIELELDIKPIEEGIIFKSAGSDILQVVGEAKMSFKIGNSGMRVRFYVTRRLTQDVILGGDFFWKHKVDLLFSTDEVVIGKERVEMLWSKRNIVANIDVGVKPGELVNIDKSNMTEDQIVVLKKLINDYEDIFSNRESSFIGESSFTHRIELTSQDPVRKKAYRIPYTQQKILEDEVEKMLNANIIEKANSPYGSPVVLVKKRDNSVRFCVDYRELNSITVKDNYPMTFIDEKLGPF